MHDQLMGAVETARAISGRRTTALAECEAAIARIEAANPAVNAVIVADYARARAAAAAADAAIAAGERRPLLGVPMTVKESFEMAGTANTWGFPAHAGNMAAIDGSTVANLRRAGAIILGKTNVPVALADIQAVNPIYGRTANPHDPARTCGGSSGGSAAAIASGMVPLEFGTDIGGSVRTPAHFCGVYGHKTSYGVIPLDGHRFPGSDGADRPLSVAGPLARCAEDLAVALDATAAIALPRARFGSLAGVRLFALTAHPLAAASTDVVDALEGSIAAAEAQGAIVTRQSDLLPDLAGIMADYLPMLNIIVTNGASAPNGHVATLAEWFALIDAQARNWRAWARFFEQVDAVLCPVFGTTAFPHDNEPDLRKRVLMVDGQPTPFGAQFAWISMATFGGLPATSTPVATAPDGLPIGIQIITARHRDHDAIALAGMIGR